MSKKIIAGVVGDVTAYAYAKAGGYTGTEEEFQALMAANVEAAKYADEVRAAAAAANEDKEAAAESKDAAAASASAAAASQADAATSKAAAETAANYARTYTGAPRVAATAAAMTDQSLIYVYTGSETGYTAGNWYFWDGTTWTSGGVYNSTALETDETLTVSGAAADAKVTGDAVDDLKSAIGDTNHAINGANNLPSNIKDMVLGNTGYWVQHDVSSHIVMPVKAGDVVTISASSSQPTYFGFLKSDNYPKTGENNVRIDYATGESRKACAKNTTESYTAPSDATVLVINYNVSGNTAYYPISVKINDIEMNYNIRKRILNIENTAVQINEKINNVQTLKKLTKKPGSIESGVWTASSNISHILFPVNNGDEVHIFGNSIYSGFVAGLKTNEIVWGETPSYSEETGWTSQIEIATDMHWYGVIPSDVKYLYFLYGGTSGEGVRLPTAVYVNGYNILETIMWNSENSMPQDISSYEYFGDSSDGKWTSIGDSTKSYIAYPVTFGSKIEILTNDNRYGTVYIKLLKTYSNPVTGEALDLSDAENAAFSISQSTYKSFTVPADTKYIYIFEGSTNTKVRRPSLVLVDGFDILTQQKLSKYNSQVGIKLMQYNIGKFAFGYSPNPSASTFGLLSMIAYDEPGQVRRHQEYSFDEYVKHYRKMLCKYKPDIVGIEEYLNPIDVMVTTDPSDTVSKTMGDMVFDFTYPYEYTNASRQQSIQSKIAPIAKKLMSYSYTSNGTTYNSSLSVSYYIYHGRIICVACNALASTSNNADMARRSAELPAILDLFTDEEYVFLLFDVNNGGNFRDNPDPSELVTPLEEGAELLSIAEGKGWTFAQGSYLPWEKSWLPPIGSGYSGDGVPIDNIIYKNNGKIILRDLTVLSREEFDELSSDHCPVVGEFLLN